MHLEVADWPLCKESNVASGNDAVSSPSAVYPSKDLKRKGFEKENDSKEPEKELKSKELKNENEPEEVKKTLQ